MNPSEQTAIAALAVILLREAIGLIRYVLDYVAAARAKRCSGEYPPINGMAPVWQTLIELNGATHSQIDALRTEMERRFKDIEERLDRHNAGY